MSSGDTGFIMLCSALVFLMTPGLAFFYGGLVRRKNVVNTMMACIGIMGLSIVMWVLFGYSLSFGGNHAGIIGDFRYFAFQGVGADPGPYADTIPHLVFAGFQMMFAVITPALITGAVVGRMRFKALFLFIAFWSLIVYYPMAHMVWGEDGFLAALAPLILPEEMSSISVREYQLLFLPSALAADAGTNTLPIAFITFRLSLWEHHCSGSDGLASMPEVLLRQMDLQLTLL